MIGILLLDGDDIRAGRCSADLNGFGYSVRRSLDPEGARAELASGSVSLVIADYGSGAVELTQSLRDDGNEIPVLVLTDSNSRACRRRIFRSGADGYVELPIDPEELRMRVKNLLWRCKVVDDATLRFGNCRLNAGNLTVETPKGVKELRHMEFMLLEKLLSYPGRIFTRAQLMDDIWGLDNFSDPRTVDTHIRRLRLQFKGVEDITIQTVRGLGYRAAVPRQRPPRKKKKAEFTLS